MFTRAPEADSALRALLSGATAASLETQTLDFKEENPRSRGDLVKTIADAVLCFANGRGGTVVVGVSDRDSGSAAITGTALDAQHLQRRIYDLTRPALVVDVEVVHIDASTLLVVHVPMSVDIHSDTQGRAPRRVGTDCIPMTPDDQRRLREERRGVDWSSLPATANVSDIDATAIETARRRLRAFADDRRQLATLQDADLLTALGVLDGHGQLLRAGEVLFCPSQDEPRLLYQYMLTAGGEPRVVERLNAPLVVAFQRVMELTQARLDLTPVTLPTGQQIQIEDFPELAVREALSNAVIHRDFHLAGPVTVEHSTRTFVVTSPGPLVAGVTTTNILTHPSKPRNPALARAARTLGLAEELGRGVDRMYREMVRSGKQIPSIEETIDHVRVVLVGTAPNVHIARYVRQLPDQEQEDTDTMLVLFTLCGQRTVTAEQMSPLLQRSADEAELTLRRLAGDDVAMIEPTRESARAAHPKYRFRPEALQALGTAVPYNKKTTAQVDRKVIAHVREYGKITNRTIQNLLEVSLQQAATILADLVERQILVKTSAHQRGPGVEYGPGEAFPLAPKRRRRKAN